MIKCRHQKNLVCARFPLVQTRAAEYTFDLYKLKVRKTVRAVLHHASAFPPLTCNLLIEDAVFI